MNIGFGSCSQAIAESLATEDSSLLRFVVDAILEAVL